MENFYVYLLLDPRKYFLPFYVGKGSGERWRDHLLETASNTSNPRKYNKIAKIRSVGFEPKVLVWKANLDEEAAYQLETTLIERFGRAGYDTDGILTNICVDASPPGFRHCRDRELFCAKLREACGGEKNGFHGKKHTDDTKEKISLAHRGKTISERHKQAIRTAMSGREKSVETRERMSQAQRGKPKSEEHRKKIGDCHRGKTISDEQKAKISATSRGRKHTPETIDRMKQAALLREANKRNKPR